MRGLISIWSVLLVTTLAQGFPTNDHPDRSNLLHLLRKALTEIRQKGADSCKKPEIPIAQLESLETLYTLPNSRFLQEIAISRMLMPIPQSSELRGLWDLQYREFVSNQSQVYSTFAGAAEAVFPLFETMPNELHLFVSEALEEMHSSLFEDTQMLTLAQELGDVANVSHLLYYHFLEYKNVSDTTAGTNPLTFMDIVRGAIFQADVRCHTGDELFRQHRIATWIFMNEWEDLEVEHICHAVGEFTYMYIARRLVDIAGIDMEWAEKNLHWEELHGLCSWIKGFVHKGIFPAMKYYNYILQEKRTDEFLGLFDFLELYEKTVLEDVLLLLGWPPATPESPTTEAPPGFPESTEESATPGTPMPTTMPVRRKPFNAFGSRYAPFKRVSKPYYYGNLPTGAPSKRNSPPGLNPNSPRRSEAIPEMVEQNFELFV